jgi:hypothetical protein
MALVDIFENVLHSFDRGNGLDIDMAPILPNEIFAVTNNPSVIDMMCSDLNSLASVRAPSSCIRVISDSGMLPKGLGKPFCTLSASHTGCIGLVITAGPMNHKLLNKFK